MNPCRRLLLACLALGGCADLSPIEEGVCGNEVLEPGEDCDVHTDSKLGGDLGCGKPTTVAECRYVCGDADTSCPLGWDCGSDKTCRRASSELLSGPSSPGWLPTSFEPVDFNGDGRVDLVGGFADRIEFRAGDASGSFLTGFAAPTWPVTGDVSVGHLDSDLRGDVLLPTPLGFLVWRGQAQGPPLQVAYAAFAITVDPTWVIPVRYPKVGPEGVLVALYQAGAGIAARVIIYSTSKRHEEVVVGEGASMDQLGDRVAVADLNHDLGEDIAFGFRGSSGVRVYGVRRNLINGDFFLGGLGSASPIFVDVSQPRVCDGCVAITPGMQIASGVQIADVDGDGNSDLLVSVTDSLLVTDAVVVARGDGQGGFGDAYRDSRFSEWPIAAGDLDADGVADYVSPNGVFFASPTALTQTYPRDTLEPWTAATLADVDGDQTVDIVAIAEGEPFVDVLRCESGVSNCTTTGLFLRRRYPTELGVTKVRAGRLQGLRAMDLALIESGPGDSPEEDALSVMYGQPFDWPEPPLRQARFHRIEQLETGLTRAAGSPTVDLFEDVQVSTRSAEGKASVGVLIADGAQQLFSAFFLVTNANGLQPEYSTAERALVGRFSRRKHLYDDLILLGRSAEDLPRVWWVPGAEEAAFAPTETSRDLYAAFGADFDLDCARFAAGDIDGDGRDEMVTVFGRAICADHASTELFVGRVTEGEDDIAFDAPELAIADVADGARISLSDLDGDGSADLVLARPGTVEVFWGGPSGLSPVASIFDLPAGEQVIDIRTIARSENASGANRVAILTDASVIGISADGVDRLAATSVASVNARSLRSADVDGDGLGDLLLLGTDGIDVLLTIPASSLGGRP